MVVLRCNAPCNKQLSSTGHNTQVLEGANGCVNSAISLSTLLGLDGQWDEPKVSGRPEHSWGYEMTGADIGVFKPKEQLKQDQVEDQELSSGQSEESMRPISNESSNRGRDGVLGGLLAIVTSCRFLISWGEFYRD